jgi:hypothetical protein
MTRPESCDRLSLRSAAEGSSRGQSPGISVGKADAPRWFLGVEIDAWERSPVLGRYPVGHDKRTALSRAIMQLREAQEADDRAERVDHDPRVRDDQKVKLRHNAQLAWRRLDWFLEAGLERRINRFVDEIPAGDTFDLLSAGGRTSLDRINDQRAKNGQPLLAVCAVCRWVWSPRKRGTTKCSRCNHNLGPPGWHDARLVSVVPVFEPDLGSVAAWRRTEKRTCDCGRVFLDRKHGGGRPRTRCRNCSGPRQHHAFVSGSEEPLQTVRFFRPDGTSMCLAAIDAVVSTDDAEDALLLDELVIQGTLRRFRP